MTTKSYGGQTAVLHGMADMRMEENPQPAPGPHDVLVKVGAVGICGSDLKYYYKCEIAGRKFSWPEILQTKFAGVMGHEASGEVVAVGSEVTSHKVGDRVAMEPGVPCNQCKMCLTGRYNCCSSLTFLGSYLNNQPGALCQYIVHPARMCFTLPENVSLEEAALLEPLAVAIHAVNRSKLQLGEKVLVAGAGPVGLLTMMVARSAGATHITATDINPARLKFALSLGCCEDTCHVTTEAESLPDDFDLAIDCTGADPSVELCCDRLRLGGRITLVGMGSGTIPMKYLLVKELHVIGVFRYVNCYPVALQLVASGRVNAKALVTHKFPLDHTNTAFDTAKSDPTAVKVVILPNAQN